MKQANLTLKFILISFQNIFFFCLKGIILLHQNVTMRKEFKYNRHFTKDEIDMYPNGWVYQNEMHGTDQKKSLVINLT